MTESGADRPGARARGLSTARATLQTLSLLANAPEGVRAADVAEAIGRSMSTAYNLLDTLCEEGFATHDGHGRYLLPTAPDPAVAVGRRRTAASELAGIVDTLFNRTHKRAYLTAASSGRIVIPMDRGRQGMRRIPGLGTEIRKNAHALALGKVALSLLSTEGLARYVAAGLEVFTPKTIVRPEALYAELDDVRQHGFASDCEEFEGDFCCLAVPVRDPRGRAVAGLGISMSLHSFETERGDLLEELRDVGAEAERRLAAARPRLGAGDIPAIPEDGPDS